MEEILLSIENLTLSTKDGKKLLNNLSFSVGKGEIVSILGLSGCGKSLTCKAILNLLNKRTFDSEGLIKFKGANMNHLSKKEMSQVRGKDICLIMQNPLTAFNPLTKLGVQLIETIVAHKKISKLEAKKMLICSLLELNLGDLELIFNSFPHTLSGGMLQRLMIGLALSLEPSLIIADEITSSIDAATKKSVLEEMIKLKKRGIAVLYVSHDIKEVEYISDRLIIMENGEIIETGSVEDVVNYPKSDYITLLMSSVLMNTSS